MYRGLLTMLFIVAWLISAHHRSKHHRFLRSVGDTFYQALQGVGYSIFPCLENRGGHLVSLSALWEARGTWSPAGVSAAHAGTRVGSHLTRS